VLQNFSLNDEFACSAPMWKNKPLAVCLHNVKGPLSNSCREQVHQSSRLSFTLRDEMRSRKRERGTNILLNELKCNLLIYQLSFLPRREVCDLFQTVLLAIISVKKFMF
jgi:hypothetical protein